MPNLVNLCSANIIAALRYVLPLMDSSRANKTVEARIRSLEDEKSSTSELDEYLTLTTDQAQNFYDKSFNQMKSLEDKAKTSIVGVTIAVSLITGLAGFLSRDTTYYALWLRFIILAFGAISLSYMVMSGWISLIVLGEKNRVYQLSPKDVKLSDKQRLEKIARYTVLNLNLNLVRSNYVYAAYRSIIYALISLAIMFLFIAIGIFFVHASRITINIG